MQAPSRRADGGAAVVAALLIAVAAAALWQSRELSPLGAIFPRTIGAAMLLAGGIVLWRALRGLAPETRGLPREGAVRGILMVGVTAAWIALLERAGFAVAGVVAFFLLALITDREPPTVRRLLGFIVVSLVVVIGFQLLFVHGLKVQLPAGKWFDSR